MPPTRRSGAAAQKKTLPSSSHDDAFATSERAKERTNSEFETELSGAFRLLSVEGSPSKVRTSDLGKLLRAIGAGEIAEMKPLENIVDINHSGFFTREKVRRFYRSRTGMKILSLCDFGFDARGDDANGTRSLSRRIQMHRH